MRGKGRERVSFEDGSIKEAGWLDILPGFAAGESGARVGSFEFRSVEPDPDPDPKPKWGEGR